MRQRNNVVQLSLPDTVVPKGVCECGKVLHDGRMKKCPACKAAIAKTKEKRKYTKHNYALQEQLFAKLQELEDSVKMQTWMLEETNKRIIAIKAIVFDM
jgi:type IV pilus biogenesis protein CpaD/CtpE